MTFQEAVIEMVPILKSMQDRLEAIDKRLTVLETLVNNTASDANVRELLDIVNYLAGLLDQEKRERDLESIRADMRAAKTAS